MLSYKKKRYTLLMFLLLAVVGTAVLIPVYITVINSAIPIEESFIFPARLYPYLLTAENYIILLRGDSFFARSFINSIALTAVVTVLRLWIICPASYVLAKVDFAGRRLINRAVEVSLLFTGSVAITMQYIVADYFGIAGRFFTVFFPLLPNVLALILIRQYIRGVPDCILEAAQMDGASGFRIYRQIVLPNIKPAWLTLIVFSVADAWHASGGVFAQNKTLNTIRDTLSGTGRLGAASVSVILMAVPVVFFIFNQNNVMETMEKSGLK